MTQVGRISLTAAPSSLCHHAGKVWAGLTDGTLAVFRRDQAGCWDLNRYHNLPTRKMEHFIQNSTLTYLYYHCSPHSVLAGTEPVCCLLPVPGALYAATGRKILMVEAGSCGLVRSFTANAEPGEPGPGGVAAR